VGIKENLDMFGVFELVMTWRILMAVHDMVTCVVLQIISLNGDGSQVLSEVDQSGWIPETVEDHLTEGVHTLSYMSTLMIINRMIVMDLEDVNLMEEAADLHCKMKSGGVVVQGLSFPQIIEISQIEREEILIDGREGDTRTISMPGTPRMQGSVDREMMVFDGVVLQDMRVVVRVEEKAFLIPKNLVLVMAMIRMNLVEGERVPEDVVALLREPRKGLLPTPDQFSSSDRGPNHQSRDSGREAGPDRFQGSPRRDIPTPESHSPSSRERSSSLQGMDMASLPPRKRPWHDGPGTPDNRDMDPGLSDDPGKGPPPRSQRLSRSSSQEQDEGSSRVLSHQIKGISKLVKLCLPKVQCFCDSLTSPPSERQ
ncbi:unnamed protein product, partial [Ranitomeya imitator]